MMLPTFLVNTIHQRFSTGKSAKMKQLLFIGNKLPSPSSSCSPRIADLDHLMILRSQPPAQSELGGGGPPRNVAKRALPPMPRKPSFTFRTWKKEQRSAQSVDLASKTFTEKNGPAFKQKNSIFYPSDVYLFVCVCAFDHHHVLPPLPPILRTGHCIFLTSSFFSHLEDAISMSRDQTVIAFGPWTTQDAAWRRS